MRLAHPALLLLTLAFLVAPASASILNGRVTNPAGTGVYPLDVDVFDNRTGATIAITGDTTTVTGDYSVTVPAGKYDIVFRPHPALRLFDDVRNGIQITTATTITTNRTLVAGRMVSGRLLGATGLPVVGVNLNFHSTTTGVAAGQVQDDITNATGDFTTLVTPGLWDIDLVPTASSRKVPVVLDAVNLATVDQALGVITLQAGFLVTASVTDLSLFPVGGADLDVRISNSSTKLFTPTDNTAATGVASFVIPAGVYDITANPPVAGAYATRTARGMIVNADLTLPNLALPPGVALTARSVTAGGVPVPNVDCDVDSLPFRRRLETQHDISNATGDVSVQLPLYKFRVHFSPPVSAKLLPVVFDSLQIAGVRALGNIVHVAGHWVTVNVKEAFTNIPVQGVNLDFVDLLTAKDFLTVDDVTAPTGSAKVITDNRAFHLLVKSPVAGLNDIVFANFRTLQDTTLNLVMTYNTSGVGDRPSGPAIGLSAPYPNPARAGVHTAITSTSSAELELSAWDLAGRRIATIHRGPVLGRRDVVWDGRDANGASVPPGVYLLRLSNGRETQSRRVAVMR